MAKMTRRKSKKVEHGGTTVAKATGNMRRALANMPTAKEWEAAIRKAMETEADRLHRECIKILPPQPSKYWINKMRLVFGLPPIKDRRE